VARISKTERLARYRHRIDHSRRWREQEGYDALWNRLRDLYKGKHFPPGTPDEDRIAINLAFSTVNVIFPSISVNHPKITVTARRPEDQDGAVLAEQVVNYFWRVHNFRDPFRRATKDFLTFGHGWLKVGYKYVEDERPLSDDEAATEFINARAEVDAYAVANPELAMDLPSDDDLLANVVSSVATVSEDRPFVERISPFDMFVDPEATCMQDARWVAQRLIRPLEDVQQDERYKRSVRTKVQADSSVLHDSLTSRQRRELGGDADRVSVWEFYDLKERTICVFTEGSADYLVDPQRLPYTFDCPFVMIRNYDVPDEFYPVGDLEMLEGPQLELDKTRSQMMNHRRKYARKWLYRESAFTDQGRQALMDDRDGVMVPVEEDVPLNDTVVPLPITSMSADLYGFSQTIESDIDTISGVNEYARGAAPEIRRTATEAALIQDAANARAADKLAVIEHAIAEVARRVLQTLQQFMTEEQVVRVTGPNGNQGWFQFSYRDIAGEYDFEVEAGSTQPNNEAFRQQQAMSLMNAVAPLVGVVIDGAALARHVLQYGFGVKNAEEFIMAQPPLGPGGGGAVSGGPSGDQPPVADVGAQAGMGGVPPEILTQLEGQVGLNL
jgi:hypothetical protein